jgi:hypothetical protein
MKKERSIKKKEPILSEEYFSRNAPKTRSYSRPLFTAIDFSKVEKSIFYPKGEKRGPKLKIYLFIINREIDKYPTLKDLLFVFLPFNANVEIKQLSDP